MTATAAKSGTATAVREKGGKKSCQVEGKERGEEEEEEKKWSFARSEIVLSLFFFLLFFPSSKLLMCKQQKIPHHEVPDGTFKLTSVTNL